MKKLFIIVASFLALAMPISAQGPDTHHIYLPLVERMSYTECKESWRIIRPEGTTNLVLNPSAEIAGNFAANGAAAVNRVTTHSHYGLYSYRVQTAANNQGIRIALSAAPTSDAFVTMRVHGQLPPAWRWGPWTAINFQRVPHLIEPVDDEWTLYGALIPAGLWLGSTNLYVLQHGAGAGDFYIDGVQVEELGHWTTYCDGTQPGCKWLGTEHAAASERSAESRAGGRVLELWSDFGFFVEEVVGVGAAPVGIGTRPYSILPGGELSRAKTESRDFTLIGRFIADSEQDLHANRQELVEELGVDSYPEHQALRVQFTGAEVQKQIAAHYTGGLEAQLSVSYGPYQVEGEARWRKLAHWTERVALQFLAPDPLWYEIGESAVALDTEDTPPLRYMAGRLRATGQWDNLNLGANPGANGPIYDIVIGPDGLIYVGGDFTGLNGTVGVNSIDYVGVYDPNTETWDQVGNAGDFTDIIYVLEFGPDGTLYAGGRFNVAGGSAADYLAQWNGAAWSTVGAPNVGAAVINQVEALVFGLDGTLYVGGTFQNWANIAAADYIVSWDGAAYAALGAGMNLTVTTLDVHPDGNIYAGGSFTTAGGGAAQRIAVWDVGTTAWSAVGDGFNNIVYSLTIDDAGLIYIGGAFTDLFGGAGGNYNYIAMWNGTTYIALGANNGTNNSVWRVELGPDGTLYAGGTFTQAGDITLADRIARWNGASWAHLDVDLPGAPIVRAVTAGNPDPVVTRNYDLFLGYSTTGNGALAGLVTATNEGTIPAYPKVVIERDGGTSAIIETIKNETNGLELLFDYGLLDGERLTVTLDPAKKSVVSNFFGRRFRAILPACDFGQWNLQPDANDVSSFIAVGGGPTITAYLLWKTPYRSLD